MLSRQTIAQSIESPDYKAKHVTFFQNAAEIVRELKRAELNSRATSKKLAAKFKENDPYKTAAKVWYFLVNQIKYSAEPSSNQTAKEIKRFIADGYGDCKHFATFSVGVLNAAGIPAWFTFVGQDPNKKKPNHAYCTALINGKPVVIDPCRRKKFNSECKYYYKWDIQPTKK